jgi:DNA-binding response OmpR family regulator
MFDTSKVAAKTSERPSHPVVLVVDDEPDIVDALRDVLAGHGFEVRIARSGAEALPLVDGADLVLLDLGLPDGDGLDLCPQLAGRVGLIVISARADEIDRVTALELGADDYLAKPFGPREVVARCRALLRRLHRDTAASVVSIGDLEIDLDRFEARIAGESIDLTAKEIQLLVALARTPGRLITREELAEEVWGTNIGLVSRSIDVHLSSLRRKLGDDARRPRYIQTVHGLGFRLLG